MRKVPVKLIKSNLRINHEYVDSRHPERQRTNDLLFRSASPLTPADIVKKVGFGNINQDVSARYTLASLKTAGFVRRLPAVAVEKGSGSSTGVWIHASKRPRIDFYKQNGSYRNVYYDVLSRVFSGAKLTTELHYTRKSGNKYSGNPKARFSSNSILKAVKVLEKTGLVKINRVTIKGIAPRGGCVKEFFEVKITPKGKRLWKQTTETGFIPEELVNPFIPK